MPQHYKSVLCEWLWNCWVWWVLHSVMNILMVLSWPVHTLLITASAPPALAFYTWEGGVSTLKRMCMNGEIQWLLPWLLPHRKFFHGKRASELYIYRCSDSVVNTRKWWVQNPEFRSCWWPTTFDLRQVAEDYPYTIHLPWTVPFIKQSTGD